MKFSTITTLSCLSTAAAFVPNTHTHTHTLRQQHSSTAIRGYLDDLSKDLYKEDATPDVVADARENNVMAKDQVDRFGPGNLADFVEFNEFDGGDGQMGVAGDGTSGLDKSEFETGEIANKAPTWDRSRERSAKNAWGTSTGYAQELVKKGVDVARAQQLENWNAQQTIKKEKDHQKFMTEAFDSVEQNAEEDWRSLAKFGIERNTDTDLNEEFGAVSIEGAEMQPTPIELSARPGTMTGGIGVHELSLKNPYMGFSDFRASFTADTQAGWSVDPQEGALSKEPTMFQIKFRPEGPGVFEGYLVLETEDFKKAWKVVGSTN